MRRRLFSSQPDAVKNGGLKSFISPLVFSFPPRQQKDTSMPKTSVKPVQICSNIKSRKHPSERCTYPVKKGDFCFRHLKNPVRFQLPARPSATTRSLQAAARKIQKWWLLKNGIRLFFQRGPAFLNRELCNNETEIATLEPLDTIKRDYFFIIKEAGKFWGFDIRALLIHYEQSGRLTNIYTTVPCDNHIVEAFRKRLDTLRRWKYALTFESTETLTLKQSWNLRVLDMCLRLDMLGYRIATQWFSDLSVFDQRKLYLTLFQLWDRELDLTDEKRLQLVPDYLSPTNKLFKWNPETTITKTELDSIRRTNLNIIERLISSASQQSDKTLAAMYTVMALSRVSYNCREAYPWLTE